MEIWLDEDKVALMHARTAAETFQFIYKCIFSQAFPLGHTDTHAAAFMRICTAAAVMKTDVQKNNKLWRIHYGFSH